MNADKQTASTDNAVIRISNLKKSFGPLEVLKDISLELKERENLVVLGKSGTGKSVLIKCIVRLLWPDGGIVQVLGQDIGALSEKELAEMRMKVGFLFQGGALYDSMSVKENLEFPLRRIKKNLGEKEIEEKITEVLENVGLPHTLNKMPGELSGGMRKRISLARTIVVDPAIILYDEPTTGLDPVTSGEISELINDIREKYSTSSLIITHDIRCAKTTAHRLIMIDQGLILSEGVWRDFENSGNTFIRSFLNE